MPADSRKVELQEIVTIPAIQADERITVVINIPSDPKELDRFTEYALDSGLEGNLTSLSALLTYKIFPPIIKVIPYADFTQDEEKSIVGSVSRLVISQLEFMNRYRDDSYNKFTKQVEDIFYNRFYEEIYPKYELKIYSYIFRRTSDQAISEDLTSITFLKMIEAVRSSRAWQKSFSGWLYRIAHNLLIDHYRERDRRKSVSIDDVWHLADPKNDPIKAAEISLDSETLSSAMRMLTDEQVQVISMRYFEGYSFFEIALEMSKTEGAVKALQHRAIVTLKKIMVARGIEMNQWS